MPAGLDRALWRRVWRAFRGWMARTFGRGELPARPPAGGDARASGTSREAAGPRSAAPRPAPPTSPASPPAFPPTPLGAHAQATWSVRWRQPLLRVACPRCGAGLVLPLWKVVCYEDLYCRGCGLTLGRARGEDGVHPES